MAKLPILSSLSAPPSLSRCTLVLGIALPLLSMSCEKKVETLFDESGVWALTEFNLGPKMPSEDESENPNPGEFKDLSPEADNGFLLNFDTSKQIVTAVSCARSKGESHDLIDSLCFLGDPDAREWRCSCFSYTFEGDKMEWNYLGGDEDSLARQKLAQVLDPSGVALDLPIEGAHRGEDEETEEEEESEEDSKDEEDSEDEGSKDEEESEDEGSKDESGDDSGEDEGRYKNTIVTVKKDPERGNAYHFSPLPGSNIKDEDGLFQSNGQSSVYVFQHRAKRFFEDSGCAKACEDM